MPNALIVDDDLSIRTTMRSILENVKFDVDEAENGWPAGYVGFKEEKTIYSCHCHFCKPE